MLVPSPPSSGLRAIASPARETRLLVAESGDWFQVDDLPPVSLATRISLKRLLRALVELTATPGAVMSSADAFAAGWPGEKALPKAAVTRVYTALHTLRRFGLGNVIHRRGTGYLLVADIHVVPSAGALAS